MATKQKKVPKEPRNAAVVGAILAGVRSLYETHEDQINKVKDESETKTVTVNFAVDLDYSDTQPVIEVRVRFSQSVTDKRVARIEDPNQESFEFMKPEEFEASQLRLEGGDAESGGRGSEADAEES